MVVHPEDDNCVVLCSIHTTTHHTAKLPISEVPYYNCDYTMSLSSLNFKYQYKLYNMICTSVLPPMVPTSDFLLRRRRYLKPVSDFRLSLSCFLFSKYSGAECCRFGVALSAKTSSVTQHIAITPLSDTLNINLAKKLIVSHVRMKSGTTG